jgi:flagellar protein FlaG
LIEWANPFPRLGVNNMTNDISSIMMAQQVPSRVSEAGQIVEIDTVKTNNTSSQEVPDQGKELPQQVDKAQVQAAVSTLNNVVQSIQRDLAFNMDEESGQIVIKVIDTNNGKLVRQMPTEEALAIAVSLQNNSVDSAGGQQALQGLLFSGSV